MEFDFRIVAILAMIMILVIGIMIITGVTGRTENAAEMLTLQLGLG